MATNLKEDKVVMGFSIALIIIVLIVLYSLARQRFFVFRIVGNVVAYKKSELFVYRHMMRSVEFYLLKKCRKRLMPVGKRENNFFN